MAGVEGRYILNIMKRLLLAGALFSTLAYVWWLFAGYFLLDLSLEDLKLYQIRRELVSVTALAFYIAWRVTPPSTPPTS